MVISIKKKVDSMSSVIINFVRILVSAMIKPAKPETILRII